MDAATYAQGLRDFADWVDEHADELDDIRTGSFAPPTTVYWFTYTREQFARAVRVLGRGAKSKDENWFNVTRDFGLVKLEATCARQTVCERVVKGTREVTTTVRDPELIEAVPLVEVTETVEDVEWVCPPALLTVAEEEAIPVGHSMRVQDDEPSDDELYNRPGVEGGIGYSLADDGPGSLGENDWRL